MSTPFQRLLVLRHEPAQRDDGKRGQHHGDDDDGGQDRVGLAVDDADGQRRGIEHEGEFAALRHDHRALDTLAVACAEHAGDDVDAERLQDHEGEDIEDDVVPVAPDDRQVERHADGQEEQAEQDAAERLDVGLELVAEGRFRQQHAGQEGAHRHRQAAKLHGERRAEHDQQGRGRHDLAGARFGQDAEERVEQVAAGDDQAEDRGQCRCRRRRTAATSRSPPAPGARKATSARSGTMARSSSSRIEIMRWPLGDVMSPRSSRSCMTMAVEVSTKPAPATKATRNRESR